jgi:filamentous hemagglutinin
MTRRLFRLGGALLALAGCLISARPGLGQAKPDERFGRPHIDAVKGEVDVLKDAKVVDFGRVIYKGKIDLNPTLERIREGKKLDHRNDGAIFRNREGKLPRQRDPNYYREFVLKMKGIPFPGPQRVILGKKGEVYYTGDHYNSFKKVR